MLETFVGRLVGMLVLNDHAQEWMILNAVLQRRDEKLNRSHINAFCLKLVNRRYDERVVKTEIFATNCAVFTGTCLLVRATDILEVRSTHLRIA
jgi:hypothetical protein